MRPERFAHVKRLLAEVSELPEDERKAYLEISCEGDEALKAEVEALLDHSADSPQILETGAIVPRTSHDSLIGVNLSQYKIIEKLGEGAMGVVYKAEDTTLKRTVALKLLPPELTRDSEAKARFLREAQAAAALDHSNICTAYEIGETEGLTFIAMAFVEGRTLKKFMKEGPLELDEALNLGIQVAEGLSAAHEKDIVHRDIKPANIMITTDGRAKIADFGLAKFTGRTEITTVATRMGTVSYMSPEQARGDVVDHRTDIWSLGAMLYEMTTGQRPFRGDRDTAVIYSILEDKPDPMASPRGPLPKELQWIVNKALAKSPDERYQTVGDMLADLKELHRGLQVGERPKIQARASGKTRLKKLLLPVSAVLLVAVSVFVFRPLFSTISAESGQKPLRFFYSLESPSPQRAGVFGHGVFRAGDVDNDGRDDVIVTAWREDGGARQSGQVHVFSGYPGDLGYGGQLIHTLKSPKPERHGFFGATASGVGDVNSDGYADIVVGTEEDEGAWDAGSAYVFSGKDGGVLYALQSPNPREQGLFGCSISGIGDSNGDGIPDVMVSAVNEDGGARGAGRVYIFSGDDGQLLNTLISPNAETGGHFGWIVAAGDINNDGYAEIVVGARAEDGGAEDAGRTYVFGGNDGVLLYTLESPNPGYHGDFGGSGAVAGDVNGDGFLDLAVGAWDEDGGEPRSGRAYVFSGKDGTHLYTLESPSPERGGAFGNFLSGAGDVDADGYADVIVEANHEFGGATESGRVYVFGGNGGELLCTLESPYPERGGAFGRGSVLGVGDVDNDGYDDVVVGALEGDDPEGCGRVYIFTSAAILWSDQAEESLRFHWASNTEAKEYWVYGARNDTSFAPGLSPPYEHRLSSFPYGTTTWSSPTGTEDPSENWTYMIVMVDSNASEVARSNRIGGMDFNNGLP